MIEARSEAWATALWRHYRPSIASGAPFYLAADSRLIVELYARQLAGTGDRAAGLLNFHSSCIALLDTGVTRAVLRGGALQRVQGETYSRAICLAVQQVLVVERMLSDVRFSENSYFPRYREMLGLADQHSHSSPLTSEEFQDVWQVLARELRAEPGASERTVTFVAGKGRDRNRGLPLSQALFTTHDLTIVQAKGVTLDECTSDKATLTALLRTREELGGRARKLLSAAAQDEVVACRLCEQVRAFVSNDVLSSLRSARHRAPVHGLIVAYLDQADAFDLDGQGDRFSVYLRSGSEQVDGTDLDDALGRRLSDAPCLFLVPYADGFREWSPAEPVDPADCVLAIVEASSVYSLTAEVTRTCEASLVAVSSNLSTRFVLLEADRGIGSHISSLLGHVQPKRMELVGGLLADARSRIYLAAYPPTQIRYDGRVLGADEEILVGGIRRRVQEFLDTIRHLPSGTSFIVQVGEAALSFSVALRRCPTGLASARLGYALHDGELDLVPKPVEGGQPALHGTDFVALNSTPSTKLSASDIAMLVGRGKRFALPGADLAALLGLLRTVERTNVHARLAVHQIAVTRSVPLKAVTSGLLRRLQGRHTPDRIVGEIA